MAHARGTSHGSCSTFVDSFPNHRGSTCHGQGRRKVRRYSWLTVQHPDQPSFQLGLCTPQPPTLDAATAQAMCEVVAKGAMSPLVLVVDDCRAAYDRMNARGVEFTQESVSRYGSVDASFRDPSGNGWKMIEDRRPQ